VTRNLSSAAWASISAPETSEVWLAMVILSHPSFSDDIRLVRNTQPVTHNGNEFMPFPFDIALPDEEAEQLSVVNWSASNVSKELLDEFRAISGPIEGQIFWVLASNPDLIEVGPLELQIRSFSYNAETISGTMVVQPILEAVFGSRLMDTANAPGLF
jgi:hypothetical protein